MESKIYHEKRNRSRSPKRKISHILNHINKSHRLSLALNNKMLMRSFFDTKKLSSFNDSFEGAVELKELNVQKHVSAFQSVFIDPVVKLIQIAITAVINVKNKNGVVFNAIFKPILLEAFRNMYQTKPSYTIVLISLCFETVIHLYNKSCFTLDIEIYDKGILEATRFYKHYVCWQKENEEDDEEIVVIKEEEEETLNANKEIEAMLSISKSHLMAIHNYHKNILYYNQTSTSHNIVLMVTTSLVYSAIAAWIKCDIMCKPTTTFFSIYSLISLGYSMVLSAKSLKDNVLEIEKRMLPIIIWEMQISRLRKKVCLISDARNIRNKMSQTATSFNSDEEPSLMWSEPLLYSKEFSEEGGYMASLNCDDYLNVPRGAIPAGKKFVIMELLTKYVYVSENENKSIYNKYVSENENELFDDKYHLAFVKQYKLDTTLKFMKHVEICCKYKYKQCLTENDVRIFTVDETNKFELVEYRDVSKDVYFDINNTEIIIFTKHFSWHAVYLIERLAIILGLYHPQDEEKIGEKTKRKEEQPTPASLVADVCRANFGENNSNSSEPALNQSEPNHVLSATGVKDLNSAKMITFKQPQPTPISLVADVYGSNSAGNNLTISLYIRNVIDKIFAEQCRVEIENKEESNNRILLQRLIPVRNIHTFCDFTDLKINCSIKYFGCIWKDDEMETVDNIEHQKQTVTKLADGISILRKGAHDQENLLFFFHGRNESMKCEQECRKDLYLYVRDHLCHRIDTKIGCVTYNKQNYPIQAGVPNQSKVKELELVYCKFFDENFHVIKQHVKLEQDDWIRHLKTKIVEEEEHHDIFMLRSYNLVDAVVNYLKKKKDIKKYKTFLALWKLYDPSMAEQFECQLKAKISDSKLEETDDDEIFRVHF